MKHVLTLEAYMLQKDLGKLVKMTDVEKALRISLKHMLPTFDDKWIDSIEDQSVEDKGIKFEIKIGKEIVHAFLKKGRSIYNASDWEFYLGKKKIEASDLKKHFESTMMSELEKFLKYAFSYDFYAQYIDSGSQYKAAIANNDAIKSNFNKLSGSDKKKAIEALYAKFKKEDVDRVFKA